MNRRKQSWHMFKETMSFKETVSCRPNELKRRDKSDYYWNKEKGKESKGIDSYIVIYTV